MDPIKEAMIRHEDQNGPPGERYELMKIEDGLRVMQDTLTKFNNDDAADLVRRAREEIHYLREVVRCVRVMSNTGQFVTWEGEPWLKRVKNINLDC